MINIRPITDLRNTGEISDICHNSDEPVFITKNGYGDMVVMSIEAYSKKMQMLDFYSKLQISEQQIAQGDLVAGEELFSKLRGKYGY